MVPHPESTTTTATGASWRRRVRPAIFAVVLAVAALLRFSLPAVPFAESDSWGYVGPAVLAGLDGDFPQVYGRNFLYPAFLRLVLAGSGDFAAITATQHLLGLVGVCFSWAAWWRLRCFLPPGRLPSLLYDAIGTVAIACYAFNDTLILHEHGLRPESLFCAAGCVMLWLTAQTATRPVGSRGFTTLAIVHSAWLAVLYTIHPSFGFALLFGLVPLLGRIWRSSRSWRLRLLPLVVLPAAMFLAHAAESVAYTRRDLMGRIFGTMTLFAFNADVGVQAIDAELRSSPTPPYPVDFLKECSRHIHEEIERTARDGRTMPTLHYNPDRLIYTDSVCALVHRHFQNDADEIRAFYLHYALRGMVRHPDLFLAKVARNLDVAFGQKAAVLQGLTMIDVPAALECTRDRLVDDQPRFKEYPPGAAYARDLAAEPRTPQRWNVEATQHLTHACRSSFGPLLLGTLLLTVVLFVFGRYRALSSNAQALFVHAALTSALFGFNVGISSTVAVVSTLDIGRYAENQMAFSVFAYASACGLALHAILFVWRRFAPRTWRADAGTAVSPAAG